MRISDYRFGEIVIGNRTYTRDIIICGQEVIDNWWRKEGHRVDLEDLDRVPLKSGSHLILGTGYNGLVAVSSSLARYCSNNNIKLESMPTQQAVKRFNSLLGERNLIGAFHLTC